MGAITQSRRSSAFFLFPFLLAVSAPLDAAESGPLFKDDGQYLRLPVLQNVGIIPLQVDRTQGDENNLDKSLGILKAIFPLSVRESRRFRMLDDDLVAGMWNSVSQREKLKSHFELSAFVHLTLVPTHDNVLLIMRLLSPELRPYLQEIETVRRADFALKTTEEMKEVTDDLVFRVFNRIPVDVSVTSIQGRYITLSGGLTQGLRIGDEVDLVRVYVTSSHPANRTWQTYKTEKMGKANIITAKEFTSVAQLVRLTYENSLEIGDGAHIANVASRLRFKPGTAPVLRAKHDDTIILKPMYADASPTPAVAPVKAAKDGVVSSPEIPTKSVAPMTAQAATPQQAPAQTPATTHGSTEQPGSRVSDYVFFAGLRSWSLAGVENDIHLFFPIDVIGARLEELELRDNLKYDLIGHLGFGSTRSGSFSHFGLAGRFYWEEAWKMWQFEHIVAGGEVTFDRLGVSKESALKGYSGLSLAALGGVRGHITLLNQEMNLFGNLILSPLLFGTATFAGTAQSLNSTLGWTLEAGVMQQQQGDSALSWGGEFDLSSRSLAGSSFTTWSLLALLRVKT